MCMNENNNFENNSCGFNPQKPFTDNTAFNSAEKINTQQTADGDFVPQNVNFEEAEQSIDSSSQNNRQNFGQSNYYGNYPPSHDNKPNYNYNNSSCGEYTGKYKMEEPSQNMQYGYANAQQPLRQNNNYSNPGYSQGGYNTNDYRGDNTSYQAYGYPHQNNNGSGNYPPYQNQPINGYPQYSYQQPKKKMGAGLIVLIVALSVLLVGSLIGLVAYVTYNNVNETEKYTSGESYDFTLPNSGDKNYNYGVEEETTAPSVNEESDYSDKTKADFGGITLNDKPSDAATNNGYTSGYAFNNVSESVVGVVGYSDEITSVENCSSQGSGIILTSDGYILTNAHVVGNSKTAYLIQIIMSDGKQYTAGVVGFDTRTDIAVLKIDGVSELKAATWGDSGKIELGEDIIVVGNPGGLDYQNSITKGVVSAVNRKLSTSSLVKYIQTDAAINPGNSGGPIVNMYGQVIGVATSKIVSEKYEGMGFAIPSDTVKSIVDNIIKNGYVLGRVKIGITGSTVDASTASSNNIPQGILISEITEGGPCDGSGLQTEDIITEADGKEIKSFSDMYEMLEQHKEGDKITIKYYRYSDKSEGTVEITLQEDK